MYPSSNCNFKKLNNIGLRTLAARDHEGFGLLHYAGTYRRFIKASTNYESCIYINRLTDTLWSCIVSAFLLSPTCMAMGNLMFDLQIIIILNSCFNICQSVQSASQTDKCVEMLKARYENRNDLWLKHSTAWSLACRRAQGSPDHALPRENGERAQFPIYYGCVEIETYRQRDRQSFTMV